MAWQLYVAFKQQHRLWDHLLLHWLAGRATASNASPTTTRDQNGLGVPVRDYFILSTSALCAVLEREVWITQYLEKMGKQRWVISFYLSNFTMYDNYSEHCKQISYPTGWDEIESRELRNMLRLNYESRITSNSGHLCFGFPHICYLQLFMYVRIPCI